ncbi:MAG: hypothetical protein ACKVX9_15610 [Blastocatellia bacterium]
MFAESPDGLWRHGNELQLKNITSEEVGVAGKPEMPEIIDYTRSAAHLSQQVEGQSSVKLTAIAALPRAGSRVPAPVRKTPGCRLGEFPQRSFRMEQPGLINGVFTSLAWRSQKMREDS